MLVLIVGVTLQPIGWMYLHWIRPISFAAIVGGVLLMLKGRNDRSRDDSDSVGGPTGPKMPGDVHGHSGQLSGGRSTAWESSHSSDGDAGVGGGSGD